MGVLERLVYMNVRVWLLGLIIRPNSAAALNAATIPRSIVKRMSRK